ncbi:hypothetical protein I3J14_16785, partial [Streptomyces sp. HB-N217]|nr:hypothetical protein [Streptomyces sp. HB-N217]
MTGKVTVGGQLRVTGDIRAGGKLRIRNPADNLHFADDGATAEQTAVVAVPVGVTVLSLHIQGAGGRSVDGASGGKGAGIQALLYVTPGDVIGVRIARDGGSGASAQVFGGDTLIAGAGSGGDAGRSGGGGGDGEAG